MAHTFIPYGQYWFTPFARWQGSIAHLNSLRLVANTGKQALEARGFPMDRIDLGILGYTNPQLGSFYGLPYVTGGAPVCTRWTPLIRCGLALQGRLSRQHFFAESFRLLMEYLAVFTQLDFGSVRD